MFNNTEADDIRFWRNIKMAMIGMIEVSREEYRNLLELKGRVDAFSEYVKATEFSIGRTMCAVMLGFELNEKVE